MILLTPQDEMQAKGVELTPELWLVKLCATIPAPPLTFPGSSARSTTRTVRSTAAVAR